jgi:hypothetical protein
MSVMEGSDCTEQGRVSQIARWRMSGASAIVMTIAVVGAVLIGQSAHAYSPQTGNGLEFLRDDRLAFDVIYLGCNQGSFDADHGTDSLVFLDFGGQVSGGTDLTDDDNTFVTDSQIEALAYQFAEGYYDCTGPNDPTTVLTLAVGTNNSLGVSESYGSDWGNLVKAVANNTSTFASQVLVWGGSDLEPACTSWSDVQDCVGQSPVIPQLRECGRLFAG